MTTDQFKTAILRAMAGPEYDGILDRPDTLITTALSAMEQVSNDKPAMLYRITEDGPLLDRFVGSMLFHIT